MIDLLKRLYWKLTTKKHNYTPAANHYCTSRWVD